ncbi:MAG: hypothetical protein ACXVA9_06705 [Bdellovibrionales bacterium]
MNKAVYALSLFLTLAPSAHAHQIFRCKDAKQKISAVLTLENETGALKKITAVSTLSGFYNTQFGAGMGHGKSWEVSELNKTYWYQVESKPAITVFTRDTKDGTTDYHFTFSQDLLGQAFDGRKVNGWLDPDAPEGGGYSFDFICSSTGSI